MIWREQLSAGRQQDENKRTHVTMNDIEGEFVSNRTTLRSEEHTSELQSR